MKNLFIVIHFVESIAMFHMLAILHVAVTISYCWFDGSCDELGQYDFGLYDMGLAIVLLEDAFLAIADNGKLILKKDFYDENLCTHSGQG